MVSIKSLRYLKELQPLGRDQVENLCSMATVQWRSQTSAVARVSEAPPEISRGAPHTLLAYYYELQ